jgi:HK97 family phage major capsid protein
MPAMLERLRADFVTSTNRYRSIEELIATEDRDPTEVEQGELSALGEHLRGLQPKIEEATNLERSMAAGNTALATMPSTPPSGARTRTPSREARPEDQFRSFGEYASALVTPGAVSIDDSDAIQEAILRYEVAVNERRRAYVDVTTADVPGIVPPVWITTIADTILTTRPFIEAFSTLPLPNTGMTLNYPKIATRPLVGKQTTEKTDIASRKTTITQASSPVTTYGGGEDVSIQVLQRTDPAYLGLMLQLYAEQMAIAMDTDAIAAAETAVTSTAVTLSAAAPAAWNQLLATAIGTMMQNSRLMPDTFVMGTTLWAAFAGAADTTGRPLFPNVNGFNPVGTLSFTDANGNVRGLTIAVDPQMNPVHGMIGARIAFTTFVSGFQTMSIDNPTKLGRDYAVFEFAAFAERRPDAAIKVVLGA